MALEIWKAPAGLNYAGSKAKPPEGEGWEITGYNTVRIPMNPNRMGSGFRTEQVPVYVGLTVAGAKEFDPKNDMVFLSSFIGSKSNIDAREFSSIEKQVKKMEQRINSLKDRPEQLEKFMEDNPTAYSAVQFYNMQVNGTLRNIRAAANQVRANKDLTIMERKEQLKQLNDMSSLVKHRLVEAFDMFVVKP